MQAAESACHASDASALQLVLSADPALMAIVRLSLIGQPVGGGLARR